MKLISLQINWYSSQKATQYLCRKARKARNIAHKLLILDLK